MSIAIVVPTNRPEQFWAFYSAWRHQFKRHNVTMYLVEDNPTITIDIMPEFAYKHLCQKNAEKYDFIPIRTGSIRSLGMLEAYKDGHDIIVTLDDDCLPADDIDIIEEYKKAFNKKWSFSEYFDVGNTFGLNEFMRGYPIWEREVNNPLIQYGGWDNVPDLDAFTQMKHEDLGAVEGYEFDRKTMSMPNGVAFTGCIMNTAMKREAVPLLYQHMMGIERVGYDRADDIWSGYFAKKICDHLRIPILINGKASIVHTRASNTRANLTKELVAYGYNDVLWKNLKTIKLKSENIIDCYEELSRKVKPEWFGSNGHLIVEGMQKWIKQIKTLNIV